MRRDEFNVKDEKSINEILTECEYGILSLISDNKPYSVALNFVKYGNSIFFHGAKEGKKIEAIKNNNLASFLVVKPYSLIPSYFSDTLAACPASQFFASVFIEGKIDFIEDVNKKSDVLNALMEKLQSDGGYEKIAYDKPMYTKMIEKTAILELKPINISCKIKVGQNLNQAKRDNIMNKLQQRGTKLDNQTIEQMNTH
jgi:nitroimidazol reductase NimA-like FMN-containing flavoprotein (pyridoxamine 5'-phosphate oxidase superfamily)